MKSFVKALHGFFLALLHPEKQTIHTSHQYAAQYIARIMHTEIIHFLPSTPNRHNSNCLQHHALPLYRHKASRVWSGTFKQTSASYPNPVPYGKKQLTNKSKA